MKTARLLIAALPLLFLAATSSLPRHQAFGPLRFGMGTNEATTAFGRISTRSKDHHHMTLAEARTQFVTPGNGTRLARNPDFERGCPVFVAYKADPLLKWVTIGSNGKSAQEYDGVLKQVWENFQDLGDCKFKRVGEKGVMPKIDGFGDQAELVTDTWEVEGVRIELSIHCIDPSKYPEAAPGAPYYSAVLKATEIAPPAQ